MLNGRFDPVRCNQGLGQQVCTDRRGVVLLQRAIYCGKDAVKGQVALRDRGDGGTGLQLLQQLCSVGAVSVRQRQGCRCGRAVKNRGLWFQPRLAGLKPAGRLR